jgi:hypothetical protein
MLASSRRCAAFRRALLLLALAAALPAARSHAQNATELYTHDAQGQLAVVDVDSGEVTLVGDMGVAMTDIAFAQDGRLFGLDFTTLYEIDRRTAEVTPIGGHGIPGGNALVFAADGTLYGMGGTSTQLFQVDPDTGASTPLGNVGELSAGDLAFAGGELYLASLSDTLVRIDLGPPASGTTVGAFGFSDVYGLATSDAGVLYGLSGTEVFRVDPVSGAGTFLSDYAGRGLDVAWGSSFVGESFQACPPAPRTGCAAVPSAKLVFRGKVAGREKLSLVMKKFADATVQADFGDPVAGDTRYEVCLYGAAGGLAGGLGVARAGDACGAKQKPCWKEKGEGWLYKNPDASPSGVRTLGLASGPAGKGKIAVKASNAARKLQTALPAGLGSALAGETAVKVQVSALGARCFEADLTTIDAAVSTLFKGRAP